MANIPSKDIASLIEADSSQPWVFGTNMFVSLMPPKPDEAVGIIDSGGANDMSLYKAEQVFTIQITVRGKSYGYESASKNAISIYNLLDGYPTIVIGGSRYILIRGMSNVGLLQYDENDRPILVMNFIGKRVQ